MNISKNELVLFLGALGITGASQDGATEGGFILPDFIVQLANTVPLPVLVVVAFIAYFIWKKEQKSDEDREIVCVDCGCVIGIDRMRQHKPSESDNS